MPVAVVISNETIRVVSTRGRIVEKWETVSLPPGLVKDGSILQPRALAAPIDKLFSSLSLDRQAVTVAADGLSFTYRVLMLPHLKPRQQREAIERAAQKEMNMGLEALYLDWHIFTDTGPEIGVFVLGIPRAPIDALIQTMALAKVKLVKVDLKSLAVARAIGQANALIVDFEADWFDITIVSRGVPVTLHTAPSKNKTAVLEDKLLQLKDEFIRTVDFYNLTHKDSPVLPGTPVILAGTQAADPATAALFLENLYQPIQPLISGFDIPGGFPLPAYVGNLGLILKNQNHHRAPQPGSDSYHDIDVDPLAGRKRSLAHPVSLRKIAWPVLLIISILLIISVSMLRNQSVQNNHRLQADLTRIDNSLNSSRQALDAAAVAATSIQSLNTETVAFQREMALISGKGDLSAMIKLIADNLPEHAYYIGIVTGPGDITIDGQADSRSDIIAYADNLAQTGMFSEIRIRLIDEEDNRSDNITGVAFRVTAER